MRLLGRLSSFALTVLFDCTAAVAFLLAYAGYNGEGSVPLNLDRAITLDPWNPDFLLRRGRPEDIEKAAALTPRGSAAQIALAMEAESNGDLSAALAHLREAEKRDKTFAPLWAQANFHFRHGNWPEFWTAARKGAHLYQGDLSALYRLCLRTQDKAEEVFSKVVPDRSAAVRQFLDVMGEDRRHAEAIAAVDKLARMARPQDREFLAAYCEQIRAAHPALALPLRNRLSERGVIPYPPLDPAAGRVVTNGGFEREPTGTCFDWAVPRSHDLFTRMASGGGIRISLSGRQADGTVLLSQAVPLEPGRRYRLSYKADLDELHPARCVHWKLGPIRSEPLDSSRGEWTFSVPPTVRNPVLELVARRESGFTRAEGRLLMERVDIRPADNDLAAAR